MKKRFAIFMASLFVVGSFFVLEGKAMAEDFSADMINVADGQTTQAKLYVSGKKSRVEMGPVIAISRMDKNVAWVLMPEQNMYMEQPVDLKRVPKTDREMSGEISRASLGMENVNGNACEKFQVVYVDQSGKQSVYQWVETSSNFPLKVQAVDGSWSVEYQNLNRASQPGTLFEIPAGYQKFEMPSMAELMKQQQ